MWVGSHNVGVAWVVGHPPPPLLFVSVFVVSPGLASTLLKALLDAGVVKAGTFERWLEAAGGDRDLPEEVTALQADLPK